MKLCLRLVLVFAAVGVVTPSDPLAKCYTEDADEDNRDDQWGLRGCGPIKNKFYLCLFQEIKMIRDYEINVARFLDRVEDEVKEEFLKCVHDIVLTEDTLKEGRVGCELLHCLSEYVDL